jgi:hypothetical protein
VPPTKSDRHRTNFEELIDLLMRSHTGVGLMEFIAYYRQPGPDFLNWEALARRQYNLTGKWAHRPSLRSWAEAAGIPDTTHLGRSANVEQTLEYRRQVFEEAGIVVPLDEPTAGGGR